MSVLKQIHKGKRHRPRRVLVYGVAGVGKSTWATSCPNPIVLDLENGVGDIDTSSIGDLKTIAELKAALTEMATEDHSYKTLVLDSIDVLETLIHEQVCLDHNVSSIEDIPYGKGYVFAVDIWREVLELLERCQVKGMMIVLIGHALITTFNDPTTESYSRYSPRLDKRAVGPVVDWCDECLFATYRVFTQKQAERFGNEVHRGTSDGARIFKTQERPSHIAKNRLAMPDEIEMSWNTYRQFAYPESGKVSKS